LIESNELIPGGEQAALFRPEPNTGLLTEDPANQLLKVINEAVAEARHNPEAARSLFALASYGRLDPESLASLRALFTREGIPQEFLSHYYPNDTLCIP
jgi:hypothetical protein